MRNTVRTSHNEGMFPKVQKQHQMKNHQLVPGCWHFSFLLFVDQLSSRLFKVSGWACEMDKIQISTFLSVLLLIPAVSLTIPTLPLSYKQWILQNSFFCNCF